MYKGNACSSAAFFVALPKKRTQVDINQDSEV